jgi:hypothetical protein
MVRPDILTRIATGMVSISLILARFPYDEFANCEPENVSEGVRRSSRGNGGAGGDFGGSSR